LAAAKCIPPFSSLICCSAVVSKLTLIRYLLAENAFTRLTIYEQRSQSGGIWNATPDLLTDSLFAVPQTDPLGENQKPAWLSQPQPPDERGEDISNGLHRDPVFLSPIYDDLETNTVRDLMGFQGLPWPKDTQLFPRHDTVLQYVRKYGEEVEHLVQHCVQVTSVAPVSASASTPWTLKTLNLKTNIEQEEVYDAVIIANGHFITPCIPAIEGVSEWNAMHPNLISHAKYFRRPSSYTGKKVLVIGNSASGLDISTQLLPYCTPPLLWSARSASHYSASPSPLRANKPQVTRFLPATRAVQFADNTTEHAIDAVIFATGYLYSLPFLSPLTPPLITDGTHLQNTYQHLFFAPQPTLSFLVLAQRVTPFPTAEAQSAVLARVYAGRLPLPALPDMRAWSARTYQESGGGRNFHLMPFPKDANYINELRAWADEAELRPGLANEGRGMLGPRWGEWEFWCRERFPVMRRVFVERGVERHGVRTMEELGFGQDEFIKERKDKGEWGL